MGKLDQLTGLSTKEIRAFKYQIKCEVGSQLPELPDHIETQLFLQGRDAWTYTWNLLNESIPIRDDDVVSIEVVTKLKNKFHCHLEKRCFKYICNIKRQEDLYHPKLSITEVAA